MASIHKTNEMVNAVQAGATAMPAIDRATRAALFATLGKIAEKECDRDSLADGATHQIAVEILAKVDHAPVELHANAILSVGHASVRASSTTPNIAHVLALVLGKLNTATRDKILAELPEEFERNGCELPAATESAVNAADAMLKRLRAKVQTTVRGSVSCKYAFGS